MTPISDSENSSNATALKRALFALKDMRTKLETLEQAKTEPIAIIGMACRFPGGANTPEAFWQLLYNGVSPITEVPASRWDVNRYYDPNPEAQGKVYTRWGGFIDQVDQFDAQFFGITPREAMAMDPQQRMLLEVAWEALERAGMSADKISGSQTGVFIGISTNDYSDLQAKAQHQLEVEPYIGLGNAYNIAAGRIAYVLGLHGPTLMVDTACSSSLAATHLACQSLRIGQSEMALVGGINLMFSPDPLIYLCKLRALSFDHRCKTFDKAADGYVRSEACGMLVLKRLSDAVADGDNILAVIRGSAINHDGRSSGLTVPNGLAQQRVIQAALANAGELESHQIDYIEAHGTGTPLGDPIEVRALAAILGQNRPQDRPLWLGSVKTNVGHAEAAAGLAGMFKTILALQHKEIPAHLHIQELNPHIEWQAMPIKVTIERTPWLVGDKPRLAGINSFGFSGTNAHVILGEAPVQIPTPVEPERPTYILSLAAKTEPALKQLVQQFEQHLAAHPEEQLADVSYTVNTGRAQFQHRLAMVAGSMDRVREQLAGWAAGETPAGIISGQSQAASRPKIAFLFTGQGSQYVNMGRQLYETQPTFRQALDQCNELLLPYLEQPLLSILYPEEEESPLLDQTAYTQPALFAIEYALATLWRSWGVEPMAVMGHSVGEYAAACVAGLFSLEDGIKLIAERGRLMQALPAGGEMAAVFADESRVEAAIKPYTHLVSIAAINGPQNVVISGAGSAIEAILENLAAEGIKAQKLKVSHAFHSPLMEPMLDSFKDVAASIHYNRPQLNIVSNVSGRMGGEEMRTAGYWQQHVRAPVLFEAAIRTLNEQGYGLFLEIGPKPTLLSLGQRCLPEAKATWLPSLRTGREDWSQLLESLATLYASGAEIDWSGFEQDYASGRQRVILPTYPFQRQRYWLETGSTQPAKPARSTILGEHPLLGQRLRAPLKEILFEAQLRGDAPSFLIDHQVYGMVVVPAAAYVEMGLAAAATTFRSALPRLEELAIQEALILPEEGRTVQVVLTPEGTDRASFRIFSQAEADDWKLHASGKVFAAQADQALTLTPLPLLMAQTECQEEVEVTAHYGQLYDMGLRYGPAFQGITCLWKGHNQALGQIQLHNASTAEATLYHLHPTILDACFQLLGAALPETTEKDTAVYLPVGIKQVSLYNALPNQVWGHVQTRPGENGHQDNLISDVRLYDEAGKIVATVEGLYFRRAPRELLQRAEQLTLNSWLYEIDWEAKARPEVELASSEPSGDWLIFADQGGFGAELAATLLAQGEHCFLVKAGETYKASQAGTSFINPQNPLEFRRLWEETIGLAQPLRGIVYLWGLDAEPNLELDQSLTCQGALHLVQTLAGLNLANPPALWLVTQGTQPAGPEPIQLAVAQAPLWGLGGAIASEHPNLRCVRVDLDPWPEADRVEPLRGELLTQDRENQIALRGNKRYVARLARRSINDSGAEIDLVTPAEQPFQLDIITPGVLDNLILRPISRREPGPDELEIEVRATGLNFRDVLKALGRYPGEAGAFGDECAGVVVAVGQGVEEFQPGDEVVALVGGSFSSYVTTSAGLVVHKPDNLSFAEAVTAPVTFLTAYYALYHLAKMSAGDRVLIHAAAGGVGLAAIQLAQQAGAEIFATAGSPRKRALLRSMGVQHIMDSRTLDFADEIMALTQGEGVDIVLNSLAGDFILKSISVMKPNGRFIEIGKTGVWDEAEVARLKPGASYFVFFLGQTIQEQPNLVRAALDDLLKEMQSGSLKPLPYHVFPIQQAPRAFRFMAQAKHVGKVVLTQEEAGSSSSANKVRPDGTYLITGGLGGLGLKVAESLADQGARHLVLMGRRAANTSAQELLRKLEEAGVQVVVAQADVSQREQVAKVLADVEETMPPLRGIIHAAGLLDDGVLTQLNWERFDRVLAPKARGSWNLHLLTQGKSLDFFILFSSISSLVGTPGQGNYAAANAFLDALSHHRQTQGLPGLSINWGPWAEVGMAAALDTNHRDWTKNGIGFIPPQQGTQILEQLLNRDVAQVMVLPINWPVFVQQFSTQNEPPLFSQLIREAKVPVKESRQPGTEGVDLLQQLKTTPPADHQEVLGGYLQRQVMKIFKLERAGAVDLLQPLNELGLDSLMAVELKNRIEADIQINIPVTHFLEGSNISQLTGLLVSKLAEANVLQPVEPDQIELNKPMVSQENAERLLATLDQLSDDQVNLLLSNLLVKDGEN
jgi:acyl transferase domain-containing protein/acyl carrier protein